MGHESGKDNQIEYIELSHIDTTVSAKNFSELLIENKTYFLNGMWGSGKTEFLKETKNYSKKKFVVLDFWRVTDERSVVSIAVSKILPKIYWTLRLAMILSVVISILMTNVVNLGLSKFLGTLLIAKIIGIVSLIVAVWSFFKVKSDSFYVQILKKYPFKNRILIIDDFDRINFSVQEQIYTLFNILENRIPIIFVGDYSKLSQSNGKFLQKIINYKVELPFVLQPQNIWNEYFNKLEKLLSFSVPDEFKRVVIGEQRNLRDREYFNDYINHEFFVRKKKDHVQPFHQLLVIYVYLFYPEYYNVLVYDFEFEFAKRFQDIEKNILNNNDSTQDILHLLLFEMQRREFRGYPYPFAKNKQGYFLYEQPTNQTIKELESLMQNKNSLRVSLLSDIESDFYTYVTTNYSKFEKDKKRKIFETTLELVKEYKDSSLIRYIMTEENKQITPRNQYIGDSTYNINKRQANLSEDQIHQIIYSSWHNILKEFNFDFSQELYLLEKYSELHFHALGVLFSDMDSSIENFERAERKDILLITYLSSKNIYAKMEKWSDCIWQIIEEFSDFQYLSFWMKMGILKTDGEYKWEINPENKHYILLENRRNIDFDNAFIDYGYTIQKIEPRLNKLKNKGYIFDRRSEKE